MQRPPCKLQGGVPTIGASGDVPTVDAKLGPGEAIVTRLPSRLVWDLLSWRSAPMAQVHHFGGSRLDQR